MREHLAIVDALEAKDLPAASAALAWHLRDAAALGDKLARLRGAVPKPHPLQETPA